MGESGFEVYSPDVLQGLSSVLLDSLRCEQDMSQAPTVNNSCSSLHDRLNPPETTIQNNPSFLV